MLRSILLAVSIGAVSLTPSRGASAQSPSSITLSAPDPCAKRPSGRVNLSAAAPAAGMVINMASSAPTIVSVPATLNVSGGASFAEFQLTCPGTVQSVSVIITASATGGGSATAIMTVLAPVLSAFTIAPHTGGPSVQAQVTLAGAAVAGGVLVTLSGSSLRILVPPSVNVPAGATSASFTIATRSVHQPATSAIIATGLGVSRSVDLTVIPPVPAAVGFNGKGEETLFNPSRSVLSGTLVNARVTLSAPGPPNAFAVQLSSSNTALVTLPASVTVAPASATADFQLVVRGVGQNTSVTITATAGGVSQSGILTITPPLLERMAVNPRRIIGGQDVQGTITILGKAPAGGFVVQLSSANPSYVLVPPTAVVPAGESVVTYPIASFSLETARVVDVTASVGATRVVERLELSPEGPTAITIAPAPITGGLATFARIDALLSTDDFVVLLSSDNPAVASTNASVSFLPGNTFKSLKVTTVPVTADTYVNITASLAPRLRSAAGTSLVAALAGTTVSSVRRSTGVMVLAAVIASVEIDPGSITGAGQLAGTITLTGPAPPGGVPVSVSVDKAGAFVSTSNIRVTAGSRTTTFNVQSTVVTDTRTVMFTARTGNVSKFAFVEVRKP